MRKFQIILDETLDTFFHLPTLLVTAIIALIILWQIYGVGLNLGNNFIRVSSNQGSLILSWRDGCCELDW